EEPPRSEFRIRARSGEYKWVETYSHLANFQGRPAVCVAIVDVSERKRAELELEANYARLLGLTESAGYYVTELDDTFHYVYGSSTLLNHFHPGNLVGRPGLDVLEQLCHPDDVAEMTRQLGRMFRAGTVEPLVARWRFENGWHWVET